MTLSFVHIACEKTISLRYIMQKKTKKHKQIGNTLVKLFVLKVSLKYNFFLFLCQKIKNENKIKQNSWKFVF